jgi:hypothetical protein
VLFYFLALLARVGVLHRALFSLSNDLYEFCSSVEVLTDRFALDGRALNGLAHGEGESIEVEDLIGGLERHGIQSDVADIEAATDKVVEVLLAGNRRPNCLALIFGKSSTLFGDNIAVEILDSRARLGWNCR